MNISEWSAILNGREYGEELTKEEKALAKENGIVIVFGISDDNMAFRGAINDEVGCFNGGTAYLDQDGIFEPCDDEDCKYSEAAKAKCRKIESIWAGSGYTWTYVTDIKHETFEILEDGDKWCQGIVFHISELKK